MTRTAHPDAPLTCDWCTRVVPDGDGHYTAAGERVCVTCAHLPANTCRTCLGNRGVEVAFDVWATCATCFGQGTTPVDDRHYEVARGVMRAAVERTRLLYTTARIINRNFVTDEVFGTFKTDTGQVVEVSTGLGISGLRVYGVTVRPDDSLSRAVFTYDELLDHLRTIAPARTRHDH